MSKIRIYELAKEVKISSKKLLEIVRDLGIEAANHMAGLDSSDVEQIKYKVAKIKSRQPQKAVESTDESTSKKKPPTAKKSKAADEAAESADSKAPKTAKKKPKIIIKKQISDDLVLVEIDGETKLMRRKKKTSKAAAPVDKEAPVEAPVDEAGTAAQAQRSTEQVQGDEAPPTQQVVAQKDVKETKPKSADAAAQKPKTTEVSERPEQKATEKPAADSGSETAKKMRKKDKKKQTKKTSESTDDDEKRGNRKKSKKAKNKRNQPDDATEGKKKLTMQKKTRKKRVKKKKEQIEEPMIETTPEVSAIVLPDRTTVGDYAALIDKPANEIILKLMNLGIMSSINQYIDYDTMELIAEEYELAVEQKVEEVDQAVSDYDFEDDVADLRHRAPVVTVMGHVDHGKTSLLDAIRSTSVTEGEAGGITQHIGASEVVINGQKIVFLDTPGHEAFTSLRARGAQVTDIAVLVVAADDGVMPQTIEAIDHARAADVPIIVAVNKIDKAGANPDRVKQELSEQGVIVEDWGGDTVCVHVSALKNENIDHLLEMILLVAEMRDLKANPDRNAVGIVIEANLDKGKGAVATVLVQNGQLAVGDPFVCGTTYGRVRAMYNSKGKKVKKVGPSTAVEVIGINDVPVAGDKFFAIDSDKEAKQIAENRALEIKREAMERAGGHVTLEDIFNQIQAGKMKELNLIIKADAHGSLEALKGSLMKLNNDNDEVKIKIQHANIGAITESDILLATASNTIVLGFNVRPSSSVIAVAKQENVEIKTYRIIYELLNDIEAAIKGMLDPEFEEVQLGEIEVRATFKVPNIGTIAGGYVLSGKVMRNSKIRLLRAGVIVHEGELSSLKRFKDDVKEVAAGYECGLGIAGFNDLKEGDVIEAYQMIEKVRK